MSGMNDTSIHGSTPPGSTARNAIGLEKCSRIVTKKGKVVRTEGTELPEGNIADIEDIYKYLGIPVFGIRSQS